MKKIGIINLHSGNLLSLQTAIAEAGYQTSIMQKPSDDFDLLVMPGQGRFAHVAKQLDQLGWRQFLLDWASNNKKLVGICVGMQLLFETSDEDPEIKGLALFPGEIKKLQHPKTPMVGWARLDSYKLSLKNQFAYFVNSYAVVNSQYCIARVKHGQSFCAAVQKNKLYGYQFHPEKSGQFGRELIQHVCTE